MPGARLRVRPLRSPQRFLDAQRRFYRGDPHYVPPLTWADAWQLDPRRNAFFTHAEVEMLVAERDGELVGRLSATRDHLHDSFHGSRIGFFGHFEAADREAAHALLDHGAEWLRQRGATAIRGPVDLSTNYRCGLLVGGEPGPPVAMMPYNPPTYPELLVSWGLAPAKDLLALLLSVATRTSERFDRVADRIRQRTGASIRRLELRRLDQEVEVLWQLYHQIWERNWGFAPMARGEFERTARELKPIAHPDLLVVVEAKGEPVAFALCIPDYYAGVMACNGRLLPLGWWRFLRATRRSDTCRVLTLGVAPQHRKNGIDALLVHYYATAAPAAGFPRCEASWILEDNVEMIRVLQKLGGREYRRYRIYEKPL